MRSMLALATAAALATGCVSQSKYNELSAEAENLDNRLKEEKSARELASWLHDAAVRGL